VTGYPKMDISLNLMWATFYDVRAYYIIFSDFFGFFQILYKHVFPKVKNIRTVLWPTVPVTANAGMTFEGTNRFRYQVSVSLPASVLCPNCN
jgi:hypothetical protein